jgi:hypothetical protein
MVEVSGLGAARRTIFFRNTRQNTARIDRTVREVAFSKAVLWAVLLLVIDRQGMVIDRTCEYRPPIDRVGMWRFAGVSAS